LENKAAGAPGCPNKCNPFHICVQWCWDYWNDGTSEDRINLDYNRKRLRMLRLYPLPTSWKEIYDPGLGRYYYWNVDTDEVCWLSPTHPKAKITVAACRVAKNEWEKFNRDSLAKKLTNPKQRRQKEPSPQFSESDEEDVDNEESGNNRRRQPPKRGEGRKRKDLDPMDPASYSDVPRGKWSSGLEMRGDAKTGVDTTASGPLFQQRPYPAPGAIMRANQEAADKKKKREHSPDDDDI